MIWRNEAFMPNVRQYLVSTYSKYTSAGHFVPAMSQLPVGRGLMESQVVVMMMMTTAIHDRGRATDINKAAGWTACDPADCPCAQCLCRSAVDVGVGVGARNRKLQTYLAICTAAAWAHNPLCVRVDEYTSLPK